MFEARGGPARTPNTTDSWVVGRRGGPARTPNTMDSWVVGSKGRPRYNSEYYGLLGCWQRQLGGMMLEKSELGRTAPKATWGDDAGKE